MKKLILALVVALAGCESASDQTEAQATIRIQAHRQMEEKVNDVIKQLREDCDSSLLEAAKFKVDSIRYRSNFRKGKHHH